MGDWEGDDEEVVFFNNFLIKMSGCITCFYDKNINFLIIEISYSPKYD